MWKWIVTGVLWVVVWRVTVFCYGLLCGEVWYFVMGYCVASGGNLLFVILVNDQLDALFFNVFISTPLHDSSSKCSSSGGPTCINTPSGITHSSE